MRRTVYLTAILLATMVSSCQTDPPDRAGTEMQTVANTSPPRHDPALMQARRGWALGCAAVLTERNHDSHTLLAGCDLTEKNKAEKRVLLSDAWGIKNRNDLFATLVSLENEGHRADFEAVGRLVTKLSQSEYEKLLAAEDQPEAISKMEIARAYYPLLGEKSLYGWDYSRAICLCRWAHVAGYISEEEAWVMIMPLARRLQEKFDSWEDLGRNYLIGRQFWSHAETIKSGWQCEDAQQRLLDMRDSPWNRYPWDLDLSDYEEPDPAQPQDRPTAIVARG
jgi:hypothetical protein